jgi:hypothetical protein
MPTSLVSADAADSGAPRSGMSNHPSAYKNKPPPPNNARTKNAIRNHAGSTPK